MIQRLAATERKARIRRRRRRAAGLAGVLLLASLCACSALGYGEILEQGARTAHAAIAPTVRPAPVPVSVQIDARARGRPVPRGFLGLSFEVSSLHQIAQYAGNGNLVRLLRSLGPGVHRFGGV